MNIFSILGITIGYFLLGILVILAFIKWIEPSVAKERTLRFFLWLIWPLVLCFETSILFISILMWILDWIFKVLKIDKWYGSN